MNLTKSEIIFIVLLGMAVLIAGLLAAALLGGWGGWMGMQMGNWGGMTSFWWPVLLCAVPLGLIVLGAGGIAWMVSNRRGPDAGITSEERCPQCGRPVERNWVACPHCSVGLREDRTH